MDDKFDLDAFAEALGLGATPKPIELSTGEKVTVRKATAAELYMILEIIKLVAANLKLNTVEDLLSLAETIERPVDFLNMVGSCLPKVLLLAGDLCSLGREKVSNMQLDDLVTVVWCEWKLNEHFFSNRIMPLIRSLDKTENEPADDEIDASLATVS